MGMLLDNLSELIALLGWCALWALGGIWLVRRAVNLRPHEQLLTGIGVGLVLENWLANLVGRFVSVPAAFWLSAGIVFVVGLLVSLPELKKDRAWLLRIHINPLQVLALVFLAFLLTAVGRGLAILDDYQNLPMTSILATGDIPPHFALDPNVVFDYHYGALLMAAQLMRIAGLHAWNSIDIVRGVTFAIALLMGALWVQRATRSTLAGFIAVIYSLFTGGTRWLMLLLPVSLVEKISPHISMIGSGKQTAPDFLTALTAHWAVDSGAAWGFPFAYASGINSVSIWTYHSGAGAVSGIITAFLLLTHNRWRGSIRVGSFEFPAGGVLASVLLAALALYAETAIIGLGVGLVIVAGFYALKYRTWRLPRSLVNWFIVLVPVALFAAVQGGVLTGIVTGLFGPKTGADSYFSFGFSLFWPPAFLSSHLGMLSLANPYQLLTALMEIGPIWLLLPFALIWGWKAFRSGRWYEAALIVLPLISIATLVVQYTGNAGPTALNRVQGAIIGLSGGGFAFAGMWMWAARSEVRKALAATLIFITMFGGIVLFGFELLAVPNPVRATFIDVIDARAEAEYWNKLEPDAIIFDPVSPRAPTLFGRPTDSNLTWYVEKPEWLELKDAPDLASLRAAGFDYLYIDQAYWDEVGPRYQQEWQDPCVVQLQEWEWEGPPYDFRRLLDIRACGE
jgi:hypothetical protein